MKRSPHQRRRHKTMAITRALLRYSVCSLNWLALGQPLACPPEARVGAACSDEQSRMLDDLEALVGHFVRAGPFERSQLGRSESKFGSLISLAKGLPSQFVSTTDDELQGYVRELAASLAPYGRIANTARQDLPSAETECEAPASGKNECFEGGVDADECSTEATLQGEFRAPVLKGLSCMLACESQSHKMELRSQL